MKRRVRHLAEAVRSAAVGVVIIPQQHAAVFFLPAAAAGVHGIALVRRVRVLRLLCSRLRALRTIWRAWLRLWHRPEEQQRGQPAIICNWARVSPSGHVPQAAAPENRAAAACCAFCAFSPRGALVVSNAG